MFRQNLYADLASTKGFAKGQVICMDSTYKETYLIRKIIGNRVYISKTRWYHYTWWYIRKTLPTVIDTVRKVSVTVLGK